MQKYNQQNLLFIAQASMAAFGTYFCMYAFRKPFTVATFDNSSFWGIDYKIALVIAQVIGYTISKFLGIKIISEVTTKKRLPVLIGFIVFAEISLLGFALTPKPYNIIFLFLNGLPLGMIWGVVFSYLEGRKTTEILGVILCSSFIISSGVVKSLGRLIMLSWGVNAFWMPFVTGLLFIIPFIVFANFLERLPNPNKEDVIVKSTRNPMDKKQRLLVFKTFAFPITLITIFYIFLTGIRDFRDNFAREIWDSLHFSESISIYTLSETPIAITVLLLIGLVGSIANNRKAFLYYHILLLFGGLIIGVATILFHVKLLSAMLWMISSGFGIYLCYIPFQGLFFDRMIATFNVKGNVGFLIYIADAFGYLGSVAILLYKNFGNATISHVGFFKKLLFMVSILAVTVMLLSFFFFKKKYNTLIEH